MLIIGVYTRIMIYYDNKLTSCACINFFLQLAAVIKEMAAMKSRNDDWSENIIYDLNYMYNIPEPLILSYAELMRVFPNPREHPFMYLLEVSITHLRCNSLCYTDNLRLL